MSRYYKEEGRPYYLKLKNYTRFQAEDNFVSYQIYLIDEFHNEYSVRVKKSILHKLIKDALETNKGEFDAIQENE